VQEALVDLGLEASLELHEGIASQAHMDERREEGEG
jgi:hypothetical protein